MDVILVGEGADDLAAFALKSDGAAFGFSFGQMQSVQSTALAVEVVATTEGPTTAAHLHPHWSSAARASSTDLTTA